MAHDTSPDHALRNAPPMMVCLLGLSTFAAGRGDDRLFDEIDNILADRPTSVGPPAPLQRHLGAALRQRVDASELIWWVEAERLARLDCNDRLIYHRLAHLRLRSDDVTS